MPETTQNPQNPSQKKARLGRGLGSLLGPDLGLEQKPEEQKSVATQAAPVIEAAAAPAVVPPVQPAPVQEKKIDELAQIWTIAIDRLQPNAQQPRQVFLPEALKELSASIKEKGILQPIVARRIDERNFEIIAGERRWRAAQLAGLHEVPVILKKADEQNTLELAIIENIQRQDLNAMEEAEAYDRLMKEYKLTQQQVAEKVGKERATVANALRLLVLPLEVKKMLMENQLSAGHAKAILALESPTEQINLAKKVVAEKLSVRATEKLANRSKEPSRPAGPINLDVSRRLVDGLSSELQRLIGTKVTIDYAESKGKISIYFYSDEELTHIVDKVRTAWEK